MFDIPLLFNLFISFLNLFISSVEVKILVYNLFISYLNLFVSLIKLKIIHQNNTCVILKYVKQAKEGRILKQRLTIEK